MINKPNKHKEVLGSLQKQIKKKKKKKPVEQIILSW